MFHKDKYQLVAIVAFISAVILMGVLFIILWNNLSANPEVQVSNLIYFLLLLVLIATGAIFVGHLLQIHELSMEHKMIIPEDEAGQDETDNQTSSDTKESTISHYNIDIDQLADVIIPRQNPKDDIGSFAETILVNIARQFEAVLGVIYLKDEKTKEFQPVSTYAWASEKPPAAFKSGEGLNGQTAKNKKVFRLADIPDGYIKITSSLGSGSPRNLIIVPLLLNKEAIGILELACFKEIDDEIEWILKNLAKTISNSFVTKLKTSKLHE